MDALAEALDELGPDAFLEAGLDGRPDLVVDGRVHPLPDGSEPREHAHQPALLLLDDVVVVLHVQLDDDIDLDDETRWLTLTVTIVLARGLAQHMPAGQRWAARPLERRGRRRPARCVR